MKARKISPMELGEQMWQLGRLADLLDAHARGRPLERHQAAGYALVLRRIAKPYVPPWTRGQRAAFSVALCYRIRRHLAPEENFKIARRETARVHRVTAQVVSTYATRWRAQVGVWLKREGLDTEEGLRRELDELEGRDC